ncbi:hypothetical protein NKDENANG_00555 [Candidatus Entotheonellaceae bacterium PAL068K]
MSLESTTKDLRKIAEDLKETFNTLKEVSGQRKKVTTAQKKELSELTILLKQTLNKARTADSERLQEEIKELDSSVSNLKTILTLGDLTDQEKKEVKNTLRVKQARLVRLRNKVATDFSGLLTRPDVERITKLMEEAQDAVRNKKTAAALASTTLTLIDVALSVAGKIV